MIPSSSVSKAMKSSSKKGGKQFVYAFEEGSKEMKELLGGKGANLAEMTNIGVPVPPGFIITTEVCHLFLATPTCLPDRQAGGQAMPTCLPDRQAGRQDRGDYPDGFAEDLDKNLKILEMKMGKKLGDPKNPLLVSVRSGAAVSMPGMMDTILNLGLNDETVQGVIQKTGNERFAYDCYRRFVQMFGDVVMGVDHDLFEETLEKKKRGAGVKMDTGLSVENLKELVSEFKKIVKENAPKDFPENPYEQLKLAIEAVFNSWNSDRAKAYRAIHGVSGLKGTAVNVQSMVFGNMGEDCGTGVAFTRNPSTGVKEFYGEFLMNAQGEDVVAGIRTPMSLGELEKINAGIYDELVAVKNKLENHYRDMQDIEFTIEQGKLFILQTRNGKRTGQAAVNIACDLYDEGVLTRDEALLKIDAKLLSQLLHPQLKKRAEKNVIAKGLPASPGAASGKIVFNSEDAVKMVTDGGGSVILVRKETSPEDISGMNSASGILTARGGMTSHAAVVCRGMGKCCVAGCTDIIVNASAKKLIIGDLVLNEGDVITLDGSTGEVMPGEMEMQEPELIGNFKRVMDWADEVRELRVRTNADTPHDSKVAIDFGAEGIGLCRTEHMFFEGDRIHLVRQMILAKDAEERAKPLEKLKEIQKGDFEEIFKVMDGLPVLVRLLDPPLHEFLPDKEAKIQELADDFKVSVDELKTVIAGLHEINPMLGHRGCRLGITHPEIYKMQVRAIVEAAMAMSRDGVKVEVEIEIPLVGTIKEFTVMKKLVVETIREYEVEEKTGRPGAGSPTKNGSNKPNPSAGYANRQASLSDRQAGNLGFVYKIGTMIEIPRACVIADSLAREADFFSFGTNDLTQMTYGYSRDDAGSFIPKYMDLGILESDPTATIDQEGVGKLMQLCVELGRGEKPDLDIGICGEHGGDPASVEFCHRIGLNYVSCSPYRVPIAKLAAAQACLRQINLPVR